jgi:hypothetical protein
MRNTDDEDAEGETKCEKFFHEIFLNCERWVVTFLFSKLTKNELKFLIF